MTTTVQQFGRTYAGCHAKVHICKWGLFMNTLPQSWQLMRPWMVMRKIKILVTAPRKLMLWAAAGAQWMADARAKPPRRQRVNITKNRMWTMRVQCQSTSFLWGYLSGRCLLVRIHGNIFRNFKHAWTIQKYVCTMPVACTTHVTLSSS